MTERERWIVYPLLFLALGASLRDKLFKQTVADKVLCEELFADRVLSEELFVRQGDQYVRVMKGANLSVGTVDATRVTQNGQPVLSFPQILHALGLDRLAPQPTSPPNPQPEVRTAPPEST